MNSGMGLLTSDGSPALMVPASAPEAGTIALAARPAPVVVIGPGLTACPRSE
jgi:hypothetical protein